MSRAVFVHNFDINYFVDDIQAMLKKGWDLNMGLVINPITFEIGQWMVESKPLYDYHLIAATSGDMLNALVAKYIADGWDFHMGTATWTETAIGTTQYLQWMCRENDYHILFGQRLREAMDLSVNSEQLSVGSGGARALSMPFSISRS